MAKRKPLRNLLIIEDNDDHAELVRRGFEEWGVQLVLHRVSDGEKAIEWLTGIGSYSDRERFPLPELILLDLRLPKRDGIEVLQVIKNREETRHIPVVMLTSSNNEQDMMRAYNGYVNSYLMKPLSFDAFSKLISELGDYWLDVNSHIGNIHD